MIVALIIYPCVAPFDIHKQQIPVISRSVVNPLWLTVRGFWCSVRQQPRGHCEVDAVYVEVEQLLNSGPLLGSQGEKPPIYKELQSTVARRQWGGRRYRPPVPLPRDSSLPEVLHVYAAARILSPTKCEQGVVKPDDQANIPQQREISISSEFDDYQNEFQQEAQECIQRSIKGAVPTK